MLDSLSDTGFNTFQPRTQPLSEQHTLRRSAFYGLAPPLYAEPGTGYSIGPQPIRTEKQQTIPTITGDTEGTARAGYIDTETGLTSNDAKDSRLFKNLPEDVLKALATEPITENSHHWSVSVKSFYMNDKLRNFYRVLTTNKVNLEFISTMEGGGRPIERRPLEAPVLGQQRNSLDSNLRHPDYRAHPALHMERLYWMRYLGAP
ncbi:UNVERIFIED_CONTAM: hypothetical protein FKN15_030474 [Acipenser sinensis]